MVDPKAPVPILVRLGKWTNPNELLTVFIQYELGELGVHLDKLIVDKRVVLLLDGLNEIPLTQRKAGKDKQVQAFIEMAYRANLDLIVVISCRERDYTFDLGFDKIEVAPLDPLHIREFVTCYLDPVNGGGTGETMFWRLVGDTAHQTANEFRNALESNSTDWERIFWLDSALPEGVKFGSENWRWERWLRERRKPSGLLTLAQNPYMLTIMTAIYRDRCTLPDNRGELFTQFVAELIQREKRTNERMAGRESELTAALANLAYMMQTRRTVGKGVDDTVTTLPLSDVCPKLLDEDLLYLAGSTSILSVGELVRFNHQLLQAYFGALYMMLETKAGRLNATDLWKPANWWEPTGWEVAAILLVGMFPEQIDWVAAANPELAAQCVARSGAGLTWSALEKYRDAWLPHLTDLKREPNPKARAAIDRALGLADLDNRPGVGLRADGLPDIVWCEVPAGEFIVRSEERDVEQSIQKLTLPTFSMSQYPITYKQFQPFIDAPDGFRNPIWWDGLHTNGLEQQQGGPDDQYFKFWNHPREQVSWYDAMAFCRWLSVKLGYEVTLPTEEQWEKAARGTDGRVYSYGNEFDQSKGNTHEVGIGQTSAVGIFPDPALSYGLCDMVGNVCLWTLTEYGSKISNNFDNNNWRVVRGLDWYNKGGGARAAHRINNHPGDRNRQLGLRLVRDGRLPSLLH